METRRQATAQGQQNMHPVRDFFKLQLAKLPQKVRENNSKIREAFLNRNLEDGTVSVKSTVKYPASQIVANRVASITVPATVFVLTQVTTWSETAQAVVGAVAGDYVGNVLAFSVAWYLFNIAKYRKEGAKQYLSDTGGIVLNSLAGVGLKLGKKVDGKIEAATSTIKKTGYRILKPFAILGGTAISPVPVAYYIYAPMIALCVAMGMHPVVASIVGGFGSTGAFMLYTNVLNRQLLKGMDKQPAEGGAQK